MSSDSPTKQTAIMGYYEAIGQVTDMMLRAASHHNWTMLVEAETRCAQLIRDLEAAADQELQLSPEHARRKHQIIRKVLDDDAQIRRLTEPRLHELEQLLGSARNKDRLGSIYRT